MTNPFDRTETEPATLAEPFGSLYAFLSDIHEQVSVQIGVTSNKSALVLLEHIQRSIEAAGVVVREMG